MTGRRQIGEGHDLPAPGLVDLHALEAVERVELGDLRALEAAVALAAATRVGVVATSFLLGLAKFMIFAQIAIY